ncbi:MAG TPA: precorrin-8X methylmutase [Coleofasciculaceae cyanobacterium]|jgi:precorrin-8X/cobalt-precorrin-8 methylmutase
MTSAYLTIKELTEAVGSRVTPRMVRHYHTLGLLPLPQRSQANYRLYTSQDVQRLRRIVALKQQGFQLSHIHHLLENEPESLNQTLMSQLQQQYQAVMQQILRLRQTATALEGLLGRDRACQQTQAEALSQLRQLEVETQDGLGTLDQIWESLDAETTGHPEAFQESLQRLLPDLSHHSEIMVDLLHQVVLASGDVSLVHFVRASAGAIAAARSALKAGCAIVTDIAPVMAMADQTRLAHLGCSVSALMSDPHITSADEAEQLFWRDRFWQTQLAQIPQGCILAIGYAPSVLLTACELIEQGQIQPALVIGMPIGFSHAPAAKRRLMHSQVAYMTIEGTLGGGLLAAVTLNVLATSLIEKPNCHCHLSALSP